MDGKKIELKIEELEERIAPQVITMKVFPPGGGNHSAAVGHGVTNHFDLDVTGDTDTPGRSTVVFERVG